MPTAHRQLPSSEARAQAEDTSPYTIHSNIPYTTTTANHHHPRHILDLYIPNHSHASNANASSSSDRFPLILYIHGGAFKHGDKSSLLLPFRQLQNGYAIAAINYRRSGEALFPAMIQDCKSALRFLKSPRGISADFGLDPERVVVWGESAGGHAAAFCGTTISTSKTKAESISISDSSREGEGGGGDVWDVGDHLSTTSNVVGIVDYYGPTDFLQMDAHLPSEWATHNGPESPESLYLGGQITREDMRGKVTMADPVTYIRPYSSANKSNKGEEEGGGKEEEQGPPPPSFFIAHGTADRIVPEFMSLRLVQALKGAGWDVEYLPVEGADHVFTGITEEQQRVLDERTDAFLKRMFAR